MIVTDLNSVNAAQELWQHAVSDRPQPGARRRVVEHAHPARRAARDDAFRRVPEEPRHRAEHARAAARCPGRVGTAGAPPLQRAAAARRIRADRARTRFPAGADRADGVGQQALRARGRERAAHRHQDRRGSGADPRRSGHRTADPATGIRPRRPVRRAGERTRRRYASAGRGPCRKSRIQRRRQPNAARERRTTK